MVGEYDSNNLKNQFTFKVTFNRKLRKMAIETGAVQAPSFVSVDQSTLDKQNIIITKGDVHIEFPCDTDIGTVTNIIEALLC